MIPYRLALSAAAWAMTMWETDPLTLPERQALTLRKRFIRQHPDAPNAEKDRAGCRSLGSPACGPIIR